MASKVGFVSVEEAAQMLGLHRNTVRKRIERGQIPASTVRHAGRSVYRVPLAWLVQPEAGPHTVAPQTVRFWREQMREVVQESLENFRKDLELAEQLGRERQRRLEAEAQVEALEDELAVARLELEQLRSRERAN